MINCIVEAATLPKTNLDDGFQVRNLLFQQAPHFQARGIC